MNQLYKIGILVAVLLFVLLVLSKLNNGSDNSEFDVSDIALPETSEESFIDVPETEDVIGTSSEALQDKTQSRMNEVQGNTTVVMKTNKGDITVELFTEKMPITAGNFLKLAQENYYDGIKFHRVIDNFMIQGGDPNTKDDSKMAVWGTGGPGYAIEDEFVEGLSNVRGTLAMANSGPNSGGSQFFINLVDNINLDFNKQPFESKHPVFGRVIDGMDVVDAIAKVETGPRDVPLESVIIEDIQL
jgi:peptidylprolyl isomerase